MRQRAGPKKQKLENKMAINKPINVAERGVPERGNPKAPKKVGEAPKIAAATVAPSGKCLAIVVVRGNVKTPQTVIDTLFMLKLRRKNHCVVVPDNPTYRGMIAKIKDYVTWGEIDEDTYQELFQKRAEEYLGRTADSKNKYTYKTADIKGKKYKAYFRLNPPRKGFGRKGVKASFNVGGALGYRGDKINDLIRRML